MRIGVVSAEGGATRWLQTPGDPRDTYLARAEWIDADTLALQQLNRLQNRNDFLQANARTGEVRNVFTDESKAWVDVASQRLFEGIQGYGADLADDGAEGPGDLDPVHPGPDGEVGGEGRQAP